MKIKKMKKWMMTIWMACFLFFILDIPVCAQHEVDTAGSSLEKDVSERFYKRTRGASSQGWQQDIDGWWYLDSDGSSPASAWRKIDGKWYYFNSRGYWVDDNTYEKGTLKGIDVSHWQGSINWNAVKNDGIEFAFIRLGRSTRVLDDRYEENIRQANAVGIPVGVYYYSKAQSTTEAILDAQFVIKNITGYKISYPVVIDIEDSSQEHLSKSQLGAIIKAFCDEIRAAGYTPMLYANENWCRTRIDMSQLNNVEKWIARYNYLCSPDLPRDIWQCSSKGKIAGISGNVDIDFGYTDYTKIITPRTTPLPSYTNKDGNWVLDSRGWWYSCYDGSYPKNTWKQINGNTYWFDANGYMHTGWLYKDGNWYYFDTSGVMMKNCWVGNYYLKADGTMATNQWVDGDKYYVGTDGSWIPNQEKSTGHWVKDSIGWWYQNSDGSYPRNTWKQINSDWYYFNASGYMHTGWLQLGTTWYYMEDSGAMVTGNVVIGGSAYKFDNTGALM